MEKVLQIFVFNLSFPNFLKLHLTVMAKPGTTTAFKQQLFRTILSGILILHFSHLYPKVFFVKALIQALQIPRHSVTGSRPFDYKRRASLIKFLISRPNQRKYKPLNIRSISARVRLEWWKQQSFRNLQNWSLVIRKVLSGESSQPKLL